MNTVTIAKTATLLAADPDEDGRPIVQIVSAVIEVQLLDESNLPIGSSALEVSFIEQEAKVYMLESDVNEDSIRQMCIDELGTAYDVFVRKTAYQFAMTTTVIL